MTPIPQPETRTAHRDPADRIELTSVAIAGYLVLAGFPLLHVLPRRGQSLFIFSRDAQPALDRLKRVTDELSAHRERATHGGRS